MNEISEFIWTVVASSAATTSLLVIAGALSKSQLTHWLSKDLERLKNQYALELEVHKVMLIADAEKIRASQEIRKASALWVLERKYKCLTDLLDVLSGYAPEIGATATVEAHRKTTENHRETAERIDLLRRNSHLAAPFLTEAENDQLHELLKVSTDVLEWAAPSTGLWHPNNRQPVISNLLRLHSQVEKSLFAQIENLSKL